MAIAKVQLPDGRIARFEVPEGTTQAEVLQFIQQGGVGDGVSSISDDTGGAVQQSTGQASVDPQAELLSPRARQELTPAQQQQLIQARSEQLGAVLSPEQVESAGPSQQVKTANILEEFRRTAPKGSAFARDLPEIGASPELNQFNLGAIKNSLAANLITDEVELGAALRANIPDSELVQDPEGNPVIKMPSGASFAINKPGLSGQDFVQFASRMLSFLPAGRAQGLARTALGAGLTETGLQTVEAAAGGEFDLEDIGTETISAGTGVALGKLFNIGKITKKQQEILDELKANPRNPDLFNIGKITKKQQEILDELKANPRNPDFAKFAIVKGKPRATAELKEAVRQFGSPETIAVAKASNPADKRAMRKMVRIIKAGKKDPLFADKVRVGDVVGDSLKRRVQATKDVLRSAGKSVDKIARTKLRGNAVDVSQAKAQFKSALDDLRVTYNPKTGQVGFSSSAIEGSGGGQARDLIKNMAKRLKSDRMDAADVHFAKRLIDQKTAFGTTDSGLAGEVDRAIKGLRSNINKTLRDSFPDYARANQKYSDAIGAIDKFQDAAGSKLNLDSAEALGVKARSFTNNTQSRARLIDSLDEMQQVLGRSGVRFKDDILTQINVANALENRFKTQGATSLQGVMAKTGEDLIKKGAREIAVENIAARVGKIAGVTDDKALDSLLKILNE
jgi:hypothetical protein